jgi:glycosyltransferase involved in cell wall biosynthesis
VADHGVQDRVKALGLVAEADLPALYRRAYAVVMPSRYEGFGLPLVEAMASGTPVLSSNRTSLPEVGGDAVAYFDPDNLDAFVAGLNSLLDQDLCAHLRVAGLQRAKLFDWNQVAARVGGAISSVIGLDTKA